MPRKHEKMKRRQHYISQTQAAALNTLSIATGVGISEHMRRALDVYFEDADRWPHMEAARLFFAGGSTHAPSNEELHGNAGDAESASGGDGGSGDE